MNLLSKGLLVVLLITMLVNRDVAGYPDVCFPDGASIKALLCIDVVYSSVRCVVSP
jgi:hypothetical protein